MPHRRSAFFISDRTGITAESLGNTLLTQFDTLDFKREAIPFIDTVEKAQVVAHHIRAVAEADDLKLGVHQHRQPEVREVLHIDNALVVDFFDTFIGELEANWARRLR
jgi:regulator of PEP synthase PpsR (kinase-PPPase family)